MTAISEPWDHLVKSNPFVRYIDINLRGAGQVMFQNNPLTGLLFLIGIFWGAYKADMIEVGIGSVVGLIVATATAVFLDVDQETLRSGLYGFNGILVGAATPTFLKSDARLWAYIVVGSIVSTVVMLAIAAVFKTWDVPALTFPFVLTTWFLMLGAYAFSSITIESLGAPALPVALDPLAASTSIDSSFFLDSLFNGVAQVFLIENVITGIIFVAALAVSSRWSAGFALIGSAIAFGTTIVLGGADANVHAGLFGFSAVLTGIALGSVFYQPAPKVVVYAIVGIIFTVIVQGALDVAVTPFGIPTFTAPFVFVTWLFLLPKEKFVPTPHAKLKSSVIKDAGATTVEPVAASTGD
jgi:urea transporter